MDGLYDLFHEIKEFDLEVLKAYSAEETLQQLRTRDVDIIFADIHMPGMNGIELQQHIHERWPRCKVIFLTGFNEFNYVQAALRNGGFDYILKTESDERIVDALRNAIASIRESDEKNRLLTEAKREMELAKPLLQKEFLIAVLDGERHVTATGPDGLEMPLNSTIPVLLILGRLDEGWETDSASDQLLMLFAIHNIAQEFLSHSTLYPVRYDATKFVWILQPKNQSLPEWESLITDIHSTLDAIQQACRQLLKISISLVCKGAACSWDQVPAAFHRMLGQIRHGLGLGKEVLLIDGLDKMEQVAGTDALSLNNRHNLKLLEQYLEGRAYENFCSLCHSMLQEATQHYHAYLDTYYNIAARILSFVNRLSLSREALAPLDLENMVRIEDQPTWEAASYRLQHVVKLLLDNVTVESNANTHLITTRLHQHILDNLGGDLSLNALSDVVHLNPSYLSRLYKQITGQGLTEYISDRKMDKAMELLDQTPLKIHEVANQIGLEAGYFIKMFRRNTGMTPQEFREKSSRRSYS